MPEPHDQPVPDGAEAQRAGAPLAPDAAAAPLAQRLRDLPGLPPLVAEAEAVWRGRAVAAGLDPDDRDARPGWRTFEDSFPTFYEFTNRPR
jgi:hypothetical protein